MKQRRTFLVKDPDSFTPEQLEVKDGSILLKGVHAVEEHRITFSLDELRVEHRRALSEWRELHIKWASPKSYPTIPPFTSRVTPGLHIFFELANSQSTGELCSLISAAFDPIIQCANAEEIALFPAPADPTTDAASQYYSYLANLDQLAIYLEKQICPQFSKECTDFAKSLLKASYLDIDYTHDTSLTLNAFFDAPPNGWTTLIPAPSPPNTIEVGVLTHEPNPDPEDIAFGGFLTVLGRDNAPKPTRFQTPTRHYPLSSPLAYTSRFVQPTGLHPTLEINFPRAQLTPPDETCTLHTHLTLPSYIFIDKYQFTDPLFLRAQNLLALSHIAGATDLEAPDWVVRQWGSSALFELAFPEDDNAKGSEEDWTVRIPLHLRYLPAAARSHARVPVPWPVVFWVCDAKQDGSGNPFDRKNLGYERPFGQGKRFMHVPPQASGNGSGELVSWIDVPVLDTRSAGWVETGTIGVVVVAFLGLCWVLFGGGHGKQETEAKEKKKQ